MKKLIQEGRLTVRGLMDYLDAKGFYVVLILSIVVIFSTIFYVAGNRLTETDIAEDYETLINEESANWMPAYNADSGSAESSTSTDEASGENTTALAVPSDGGKPAAKTDGGGITSADKKEAGESTSTSGTAKVAILDNAKVAATEPAKSEPVAGTNPMAAIEMAIPVFGDVSFEFAMDRLTYSQTLDEWMTHSGIDIAAERGTGVKAAADGTVSEIKTDPRFGVTVILDHADGTRTVYANLAGDEMVTVNQKVLTGEIIGSVGNTAVFESAEQSHLHFEVLKDNVPVNPAGYFKK